MTIVDRIRFNLHFINQNTDISFKEIDEIRCCSANVILQEEIVSEVVLR